MNYSEMVYTLTKPGEEIVNSLSPMGAHMLHMAAGISCEAGELLDSIKKTVIYNKPIDRDNIVEELGDLEFYMEGLRQRLSITREQCIEAKIVKLSKRYHAGKYSDKAAQERADKSMDKIVAVASQTSGIPESLIVGGAADNEQKTGLRSACICADSQNTGQECADKRITEATEVTIVSENMHFKQTRIEEDVHDGSEA